ncbi:unnamed protein product [Dicrocoelium dendriticum]|nr:unnamed protein product [Dicrocoelium dendriticum]
MYFVITGVLDSIERDDARALIERCGGKVLKTLGKKTTHLVVGREPGESKLAKAETMNLKQLNEDELFALIRELAGEPLDSTHQAGLSPSNKSSGSAATTTPPVKDDNRNSTYVARSSPSKSAHSVCNLTAKPVILTHNPPNKPDTSQTVDSVALSSLSIGANSVLWVDKYKPTSRRHLIGQTGDHSPANKLYNWLSNWHSHFSAGAKVRAYSAAPPWASGGSTDDGKWARAALLSGPPGIGKTSTAFVVCSELQFSTCELNASDSRSKKLLQEEISEVLYTQSVAHFATRKASQLNSKHSVLLMDEVDGMAGNEDRGGMQELINMIKTTRIPIICMCNDRQSPKIRSLANYCLDLRFHRPRVEQIKAAIMSILCKENVSIPPTVLNDIILASNHDIRQIINNTQMWCSSNLVDQTQLSSDAAGAQKDLHLGAFDVIRKVFTLEFSGPNGGPASINDSLGLFFQDYSLIPLFVQENYLNVKPRAAQNDPKRVLQLLSRAANEIALGDVVGSTIRTAGAGYWSLLPVQGIFSVVLPGRLLHGPLPGGGPGGGVNFPSWFGKYSHQGRMQRVSASLAHHLSLSTHGGCCNTRNLILDYASPLSDSLTRPLKQGDTDTVLNTLIAHQLQREDMDCLLELTTWSNRPNRLTCIDSKVKAALTRTFNRSSHLLPYATTIEPKSRGNRGPTNISDVITEYDDLNSLDASEAVSVTDDVEDLDDLEKDGMIVRNKKPLSKQKADRSQKEKMEKKVSQSIDKPARSKSSRGRSRKTSHSTD